jgi:hypothetical protein
MTTSELHANLGWQGEGDLVIGKAKAHRGDAEARRTGKSKPGLNWVSRG